MPRYSHETCLERAHAVNWTLDDVLGERAFDEGRDWLPRALSGAAASGLSAAEQRLLTHVEMAAYAHLFAYAEEFVAPTVVELAADVAGHDRPAFDALTQFAAEEVKHMAMFRALRERIDDQLGFELERLGGEAETTRFVRGKHRGAVLLLTACIEWFTQRHYLECFRDAEDLDGFTRHVFEQHWLEECQHAQLDHLETLRVFAEVSDAERERAVSDLIDLVAAFDGLLQEQARCDVANFRRAAGRPLELEEVRRVQEAVLRAKRHTFLETGLTHPRFVELLEEVTTPAQRGRLESALTEQLHAA